MLPSLGIRSREPRAHSYMFSESMRSCCSVVASSSCKSSFLFQLKTFSADDYDKDWPHEHVNENSTRFTITLSNLPTSDKKSRYAVHVGFVTKSGKDFEYYLCKGCDMSF